MAVGHLPRASGVAALALLIFVAVVLLAATAGAVAGGLDGHIPLWFYLLNNVAFFTAMAVMWWDLKYRDRGDSRGSYP